MSAKKLTPLKEFFLYLGAPHQELCQIVPRSIHAAEVLGLDIMNQPWFDINQHGRGHIFPITDTLRDLRQAGGHDWQLICALIDALPAPANESETYHTLWHNLVAMRHQREVCGPRGLHLGFHVLPENRTTSSTEAVT